MGVTRVEQKRPKRRRWHFHLIGGLGILLTIGLIVALIYFWDEMQQAQGYGYLGEFLVSIPAGITLIPAPSFVVTFALGRVLNPVYVGLLSGLGEAIGGIVVYLTGSGAETMWSRFVSSEVISESQLSQDPDIVRTAESKFWYKSSAWYNRLVGWVGGRGGGWVVFIASAVPVLNLFYPAGIAAGSLRMGLLRFFLISWAGKTLKGLIIAFAGHGGLSFLPQ
ncbi:MAG: VTT domain-containing protein [Chloroflexi bacterium]|nr:VTT domain-containing protein [Chloroflexota bacterium]